MGKDSMEKPPSEVDDHVGVGEVFNASGHKQELDRQFSLLSVCSVGITTGNVWAALGGSIVIALYNGGPAGVIYEFIAVSIFYFMIAACIAEMSSAIPSAAGVYTWANITAGEKYGRIVGYFAGWWNFFGWIFGTASMSSILANQIISMYGLFHPGYEYERWHVFIVYLIITWMACFTVMFANRALPLLTTIGLILILGGCFITIMVCAIMPSRTGKGYASNSFVWREWQNQTGWSSDGFVFCAGMLNGAYAVGTPDCVSHLAEEIPNPRRNVPKAILAQYVVGFLTAFLYVITIFYSVNDLDSLFSNPWPFPLAELYRQSTNSTAGSLGLLIVIFLPTFCTNIGCYLTSGRMLWTLGRDGASPFSAWIGKISPRYQNPWNATLVCGVIDTILGCIYIGSSTAFSAFVGSFIVMSSFSYLAFILPNILSRRRHVVPGPFSMPNPVFYTIGGLACAYMCVWIVVYCFPYAVPFDSTTMNYSCVLVGGLTIIMGAWYAWIRKRGYEGPRGALLKALNGLADGDDGPAVLDLGSGEKA
ncbi:amino acid transporter [Dothidotthia symphoricarpi CBS 119687]|uniref:Amino acid transporter n=1 Tax=Dothidotthia symphoricarpi CBS 119687 TaxID=1392245 RepID=A0A6A6AAM4_9PLEO|nr:amino acid transporter [Dothidotthia symphoricarpi CBS 119687]KAF2128134.1 amino acid transporter [Dothidotthia symphoricarpi CBS 119687]